MRFWLALALFVFGFSFFAARAQDRVNFEVAAPTAVEVGELFRIEFVVNADPSEFVPPTIEGFDVMAGPSKSQSQSVSIVNGDMTRTETVTYTYVLQAFAAGLHNISSARVTVDGKSYYTRSVTIEVAEGGSGSGSGGDGAAGSSGSGGSSGASGSSGGSGGSGSSGQDGGDSGNSGVSGQEGSREVAADDIFLRATVNRTSVYKGEPVVVTLKLYSRVQFNYNNDLRWPTFNGFWQQDISPDQITQGRETLDGRVYNSWVLKEYLLYPQQSGALVVEPFAMSVNVLFQVRDTSPRNIFDELMGGGAGWEQIRRQLSSGTLRVDVRDWPEGAPAGFDGAVGDFELDAVAPPPAMNANTSGSYVLKLSGTGNFPLIRAPHLSLPDSFEQYNVTTSDNTRNTRVGTSGHREFSYPFIPRADGLYAIQAPSFSFFNPRLRQYVTLSARETSIEVTADSMTVTTPSVGVVGGLSRDEMKVFGQDIRYIKRGGAGLGPKGETFLWSWGYFSLMGLCVVLFVGGYPVLSRLVRDRQNDRLMRGKRANKVALKRFRAAEASMKQDDRRGFYDEMLKALWGYMSDRMDIPMAVLTKDRICEELFERSVPQDCSDSYVRIISECEEAQYSPSSSARMTELYREGVALLTELESTMKKR
jgi:hypothetical protein